jgi:CBS-domain-containing membrane protein
MLAGQGWLFLFTPVLVGAVLIVLVAKAFQQVQAKLLTQP